MDKDTYIMLGEIRSAQQSLHEKLDEDIKKKDQIIARQDERIRSLEAFQNNLVGRITVISFIFGIIGSIVTYVISRMWMGK